MPSLHALSKKSLVIIFAYAPIGLGHLRVTDALYHGLPTEVSPILLGSQDTSISTEYRFVSVHPFIRALFVASQNGWMEQIFTFFYRMYLRNHTHLLYQQLTTIMDERFEFPETILLVATHFGLAHQLAAVKKKLADERKLRVILAVQVTDDTPQPIWYVPDADCIFVASEHIKEELMRYGKDSHLPSVPFIVNPYPVSPTLGQHLTELQFHHRIQQLDPNKDTTMHVSIPISGAAVGTAFFQKLIDALHAASNRYHFHVVAKEMLYTRPFITNLLTHPYVSLLLSSYDRGTVDNYESLYQRHVIGLEITKPSEQAFKALLRPYQVGGCILLFAEPVGQQEKDNLAFMRRHKLIPSIATHQQLWHWAQGDKKLSEEERQNILGMAKHWRGVELPNHSLASAKFIHWCLEQKIFATMLHYEVRSDDTHLNELGSQGVQQFWQIVSEKIQ